MDLQVDCSGVKICQEFSISQLMVIGEEENDSQKNYIFLSFKVHDPIEVQIKYLL